MKVEYLSDNAREQLGASQHEVQTAVATLHGWQQEQQRALFVLEAERRAKPLWKRLLSVATPSEAAARAHAIYAAQNVTHARNSIQGMQQTVQQQAAGVHGEDALMWGLASLSDDWVMLRGYRNRRGETDSLLIGPFGVWAIEVKRRAVRVHVNGDEWRYEKLDRWGNVVDQGWATDKSGRSWARQVTDVADDLAAWLRRNREEAQIRTAVMIMHERAQVRRCHNPTVNLIANDPQHLLAAIAAQTTRLSPQKCDEIAKLVRRDHQFHQQRRSGIGRAKP